MQNVEAKGRDTARDYVLVVDDDRQLRKVMSAWLVRQGHQVAEAASGAEALLLMKQEAFDLVLLDVMMPQMDGYEVLAHVKADKHLSHLPVIMISGYGELDVIARCIELGAEDCLSKPVNDALLSARVNACLEKKHLRDTEQRYFKAIEHELEIGREIQRGFLPEELPQPPGWEVAARFEAARQVAGDFYDAFTLAPEQHVAFIVGDVCDKGVGAALFMALFRSLLRAVANHDYSGQQGPPAADGAPLPPAAADAYARASLLSAVRDTNNYIACTHRKAHMFATLFFGAFDPLTGTLRYINGGHEPPLLLGPYGIKTRLGPTGPAVGIFPDAEFTIGTAQLEPGDLLFIYSDGVFDARNAQNEPFGEERLLALVECPGTANELLDRVGGAVSQFIGAALPFDDITMMAVRRLARSEPVPGWVAAVAKQAPQT